jgi:hypothetical protein
MLTRSSSTDNRHQLNGLVISLHFRLNLFNHKDRCNKEVNLEVRSDNKLCDGVERWAVPIRHILVLFRDLLTGIGIEGLASPLFPPFFVFVYAINTR